MARGLRSLGRWGSVCVLGAATFLTTPPIAEADPADTVKPAADLPHADRKPVVITSAETGKPPILVYPARSSAPRPALVMLHGMCDAPENECPAFAGAATDGRVLLCPRADLRCDGGGTLWSGKGEIRASLVESFLDRASRALPATIEPAGKHTLVGFSLGAFAALDVAQRSRGTFKHLILLGAKIEPDAQKLKEAGIESVLLGAGERDMMKPHMMTVAAALAKKGVRSRFVSMGNVGHWFSPEMNAWLEDGLAWLELPRSPPPGS